MLEKQPTTELNVCFRSTLQNGAILQRTLLLKKVTLDDLKSTFTCVVTNAAGTIQKYTSLAKVCDDCKAMKTTN